MLFCARFLPTQVQELLELITLVPQDMKGGKVHHIVASGADHLLESNDCETNVAALRRVAVANSFERKARETKQRYLLSGSLYHLYRFLNVQRRASLWHRRVQTRSVM